MNKIIIRFIFVKNNDILEVIFDQRLSFNDNFKLLNNINSYLFKEDNYIYDENKGVFLNKDIPLKDFNLYSGVLLSIF